jgi:hypothetical protein
MVLFWWLFGPCPSSNSNSRFTAFLSRLSRRNSRLEPPREFVCKHLISYMILRRNDCIVAKTDEIPGLFPVQREFAIINGGGAAASAGRALRFSPPRAHRAVDRDRCRPGHRCRGQKRRRSTARPLRSAPGTQHGTTATGGNAGLLSLQEEGWLRDKLPTILDRARTPWREHNGATAAQTFRLGS